MPDRDFALPDFCNQGEFWKAVADHIGYLLRLWTVAPQLDQLRGKIDEEVPALNELVEVIVGETFLEVQKSKPKGLEGKSEVDHKAYFCRVARNILVKYLEHLRKVEKDSGVVVRLQAPAGRNSEGDDESMTVGSLVEDPSGITPFTSIAVEELNQELQQFLSEQFGASRPHMEEFHELVTGLHDTCWNPEKRLRQSMSIRDAVDFLDAQYPPCVHNKDRYHQGWLNVLRQLKASHGVEVITRPRGSQNQAKKTLGFKQ